MEGCSRLRVAIAPRGPIAGEHASYQLYSGGSLTVGHLRKADPLLATWHFRRLVESDLVERRLHGEKTITGHEIKTAVEGGVDAFLRANAPLRNQ
jgi:hypothetical protein